MFAWIKKGLAVWATFWIGVVVAIVVAVALGWKAGLLVFALTLLVTVVLIVLAARKAFIGTRNFFSEPPPRFSAARPDDVTDAQFTDRTTDQQ